MRLGTRLIGLTLLVLAALAATALGQTLGADRASIGGTKDRPEANTSLRVQGLATTGGTDVLFLDAEGDARRRLLLAADVPSTFTQRTVAEAISQAWSFNAGLTVSGNITFAGTGRRILGDFSNATHANRTSFQSSTTDGQTAVHAIPNGTNTTAQFVAASSSTGTNTTIAQLISLVSEARLSSATLGTASYVPLTLYTGGLERVRVDTTGAVTFGGGGAVSSVSPATNYATDLGGASTKYRTLWAGELFLETLVAQQRITTMGGRLTVTPSNVLTRDLASGTASPTAMCVKYNSFLLHVGGVEYGSKLLMEKNGQVEWIYVNSTVAPTVDPVLGDYCYSVLRDQDGSGQNTWTAGDGIIDTGKVGSGAIDQYAVRGMTAATLVGPSIDFLQRTGAAWNDLQVRASVGNLRGKYGYASDIFGLAAGSYAGTWVSMDSTNGFRIMYATASKFAADTSGNLSLAGNLELSTGGDIKSTGNFSLTSANGLTLERSGTGSLNASRSIRIGTSGNSYSDVRLWSDSSGWAFLDAADTLYIGDGPVSTYAARNTVTYIRADGTSTSPGALAQAYIKVSTSGIEFGATDQSNVWDAEIVRPVTDDFMWLGSAGNRWKGVHANAIHWYGGQTTTVAAYPMVWNGPNNRIEGKSNGFNGTLTVRDAGGGADCNIVVHYGIIVDAAGGTTC